MTTDDKTLTEQIARALYENADYYGPMAVQPPWSWRDDEERGEWREIAAAVLPIIRKAERDAAREALASVEALLEYAERKGNPEVWTHDLRKAVGEEDVTP